MNLGYDEGVYTVIDYDIDTVNDFFRIIVEEPVIGDRIPILDGVITIEKLKALPYDINDEINITIVNKNYVELYPKYNYAKITFKESDLIDYYNYSNFNEHTVNLYDDDEDQCLKDDIADGLGINNFKYNFTDEFIDILQDYNSIDSKYESSIIKIDKRDNNFTQYHYLNTYDLVEFFSYLKDENNTNLISGHYKNLIETQEKHGFTMGDRIIYDYFGSDKSTDFKIGNLEIGKEYTVDKISDYQFKLKDENDKLIKLEQKEESDSIIGIINDFVEIIGYDESNDIIVSNATVTLKYLEDKITNLNDNIVTIENWYHFKDGDKIEFSNNSKK